MKPAHFDYERPTSLDGVLALLSNKGVQAKILAGGQSLVPMMNFRMAQPELLIDINRLEGFDYHRVEGKELVIGALCRHATLRNSEIVRTACPLMSDAYAWVAHGPVRNRGTLCGNLCHADPASEMPTVAQAVSATMLVRSKGGERRIPASDFFLGVYETALRADEMLTEVRIPIAPKGQGWGFHEVSARMGDFAIVAACATMQISRGNVSNVAIAVAGCGARPVRLGNAERALVGKKPDDGTLAQIADACAKEVDPSDDIHGDVDYRRDLVRALGERALRDARKRCV